MSASEATLIDALQAHNTPVDANDFDIEINVLDEDGNAVRQLIEFSKTVVNWSYELAPDDGPDSDDEDDIYFDDLTEAEPVASKGKVEAQPEIVGGRVVRPGLLRTDDDEDDDQDDDDEEQVSYDPERRELVLMHQVTGAAFRELNKYVFEPKDRPEVSVEITYYATVEQGGKLLKAPIFVHTFYGIFYVTDDLSGNRLIGGQRQGPLLLTMRLETLAAKTFGDPADQHRLASLIQETSIEEH